MSSEFHHESSPETLYTGLQAVDYRLEVLDSREKNPDNKLRAVDWRF